MAKVTKKWEKEFPKRYSNAIKELQSLENEFQQMVNDNPDSYISVYPDESFLELGQLKSTYSSYYKADQDEKNPQEHVEITFNGEVGSFSFLINSLEELIKLRTTIIELADKFSRPEESVKVTADDECEEDDENWEDNPYEEYTIQASRECVQTWTHTVQARSSCEAYRLVQEDTDGSTNDENDDYDNYGEISWEII